MVIKSAEFVISNSRVEKCPTTGLPEYAFIGRSNVGKSSLINMLTARKGLAMTSQKPGKTQLINHFIINDALHFSVIFRKNKKPRLWLDRRQTWNILDGIVNEVSLLVNPSTRKEQFIH